MGDRVVRELRGRMSELLVGTSGWSYRHWAHGVFYPPDVPQRRWLESYAERFSAVELNVTFYRLPKRETFEAWERRTPRDFRFAAKGSRRITHFHRLRDCDSLVESLVEAALPLREKLAAWLWQLPPAMERDASLLEDFCALLDEKTSGARHAFEFRNASWFERATYDVLAKHGHALCVAHSARWPHEEVVTTDFAYLRFHGGEEGEDGEYSDCELARWAARAETWLDEGLDVMAFFNNDWRGYAPANARVFREMTDRRSSGYTAAGVSTGR